MTQIFHNLPLGCPSPLIPQRPLFETARIAVDPLRAREFSLPVGIAVEAGARAAQTLVPPLFRVWQARERPLREMWEAVVPPRPVSARPPLRSDWVREIEGRHPKAWVTHPRVRHALELADQDRIEETIEYVRQNRLQFETFLRPVLLDLIHEIRVSPLGLRSSFAQADVTRSLQEEFPISRFGKSNLRGVKDYDRDLFGKDPLDRLGANLRPEETLLWKIIDRLMPGAHVADWGSGAGVFGHEIKRRRPDLRVTSVDLFSPEDILSQSIDPPVSAETLRREMDFLTGNAVEVSLPKDRRADLLVTVFLLPWTPDPLSLFSHMYNQVKPGGLMVATVHAEIYDGDRTWGERSIFREIVEDLRRQGVEVEAANDGRTLVLRRPSGRGGERDMEVSSRLIRSTFEEIVSPFNALALYHSFYRRVKEDPTRWVSLK